MARPVIAISGRRRSAAGTHDGPDSLNRLRVDVYFAGYADRLVAAGALPIHIPATVDPRDMICEVDGLVLSGGNDVDPAHYGRAVEDTTQPLDKARDAFELKLLDTAVARGLPVLAICRGLHILNIHRGGTLNPHLTDHPLGGEGAHEVRFTRGSQLAHLYGPVTTVNSMHHQCVDVLGQDLVATGVAPDGVIEAVEWPDVDVLGVQWHPEQLTRVEPVFDWLTTKARSTACK